MKTALMFGKLFHYQQLNFIVEHPVIQFDTLYQLGACALCGGCYFDDPTKPHYFTAWYRTLPIQTRYTLMSTG